MEAKIPIVYLDLETVPTQREDVREWLKEDLSPPANYKDEKKIAAWMEEHGDTVVSDTGLQPLRGGEIIMIGWKVEHHDTRVEIRGTDQDEGEFLKRWWHSLRDGLKAYHDDENTGRDSGEYWRHGVEWCGHNIREFDIPFLAARHFYDDIKNPISWRIGKPWEPGIIDTMEKLQFGAWKGSSVTKGKSLKWVARMLGWDYIEMKPAEIEAMWKAGNYDPIERYCRRDVELTYELHHRLMDTTG